jgi:predicted esterase
MLCRATNFKVRVVFRREALHLDRRRFCGIAFSAIASFGTEAACTGHSAEQELPSALTSDGRIGARPRSQTTTAETGTKTLGLDRRRDAILQLPGKPSTSPLPLLVLLHGAGGSGAGVLRRLGSYADENGIAVLAPDSRDSSWDGIRGDLGPDVHFLNRALNRVFATVDVDPERLSVGGFSDGATYAVSLGLINGDLFRRVVAFSPGFVIPGAAHGKPRFFISHGTADRILPIDRCSRVIVPRLQKRGYDVTFREFEGGHDIPPAVAREGMTWMAAAGS